MGRSKRNRPSLRGSCDVTRDAMTLHRRQTPPHVAMEAKSRDKIKPAFSEAKGREFRACTVNARFANIIS